MIDGGNSYYHDDIRRAKRLGRGRDPLRRRRHERRRLRARARLLPDDRRRRRGGREPRPDLRHARARASSPPRARPGRTGEPSAAEQGYLHCGPSGAGHFVKMVHNGIEYGIMAAYAEGLNILKNAEHRQGRAARSTPRPRRCEHPEYYQYDIDLPEVAEVWRRGSVVGSWLLDLTAQALQESPDLVRVRRSRLRLGRGPLDIDGRDRGGRPGSRAHDALSTPASPRAARPTSPTRCCRRCARSSAATLRSRPRDRGAHRHTPQGTALLEGARGTLRGDPRRAPARPVRRRPRSRRAPGGEGAGWYLDYSKNRVTDETIGCSSR